MWSVQNIRSGGVKFHSGTVMELLAGASLRIAGTALAFTAAQLNGLLAAFGTVPFDRAVKVARVPLVASDSAGGVFAWQNPESSAVLVERVVVDVTTPSAGACTLDVGATAASAATLSDNLIDGVSLASAAKVVDNLGDTGTNGRSCQKVGAGEWVTGSVASGAAAGLVGSASVYYVRI